MVMTGINSIAALQVPDISTASNTQTPDSDKAEAAAKAGAEFEALFIAQMLEYSGLSKAFTMNGGEGVAAFSRFMIEQLAEDLVDQGGFGLSESITQSLLSQQASQTSAKE
jgi:peptidoglycan hydrolase FlgJ